MPTRAPDFKFIPASSIGIRFSDNDSIITFGVEDESSDSKIYEQVSIVMSHKTLKLLGQVIQQTIDHYEQVSGTTIFFDPTKLEALKQAQQSST
ncbi:hypothetical protein MES5069_180040 [Mesorhizobium escarrei]|uniref:DUF3467 domain-containing protein n=1 Tax=Mesorhizobium escarrei TaxID=666018 RepID=A0ABM9DM41_9HYPH|nr:hypothetical protein MES5069_180040 [Mesorhizobium escarrei]